MTNQMRIARAALHYWEEPCISGKRGSGAIFFSGCPLHCVYCQNEEISHGKGNEELDIEGLARRMIYLQEQGAHNINLVTGTQYWNQIIPAIDMAREKGLLIPVVYNTGGYEKVEAIEELSRVVDVFLPDFKYFDLELAKKYSNAPDYPETARRAIEKMVQKKGECLFDDDGMIKQGVIVRQLLLPGSVKDFQNVTDYLFNTFGNSIYISMMSQYTPMKQVKDKYPILARRVTKREYERAVNHAIDIGVENAFIQDRSVAKESFIPEFCE